MTFYVLGPEVAGGWGSNIEVQRDTHPPVVTHLHYEFEGWLGDDLLTTVPDHIVTEALAQALAGRPAGFPSRTGFAARPFAAAPRDQAVERVT